MTTTPQHHPPDLAAIAADLVVARDLISRSIAALTGQPAGRYTTTQVAAADLAPGDRVMIGAPPEPGPPIIEVFGGCGTIRAARQDGTRCPYPADQTVTVQTVDCPECEGQTLSGAPCSTCNGHGRARGSAAKAWLDAAFTRPCISEPGDLDRYLHQLEGPAPTMQRAVGS